MRPITQLLLGICIVSGSYRSALGFNELGHCVIAKIAYDNLSDAQRDAIHNILKVHPHYAEYLAANAPPDVPLREWSFLRASTWPDWVRSHHTADYHKSEWHYINYPYRLRQADTSTLPAPLPQAKNILERLPLAVAVVKGGPANDLDLLENLSAEERRAVAVCWLFHLIGDLHQPLHVVALIDEARFPEASHGDRGGNELALIVTGARPLRLHSFWDGALGFDASYGNVSTIVKNLRDDPPISAEEMSRLVAKVDFNSWALESYQLAAKYAYLNGDLPIAPWKPAYNDAAAVADSEVPQLKPTVIEEARAISRQRLYLAGRRLAEQLKAIFPKP